MSSIMYPVFCVSCTIWLVIGQFVLYKYVNKLMNNVVLTSSYVPSVWLNVHDCTPLLVQRHHTIFGKHRTNRSAVELVVGLCRQVVNEWSPPPKNCHQNIIIATLYRIVVVCRTSLQMFSKHCRFMHNTMSVKTLVLHYLSKCIDNTS